MHCNSNSKINRTLKKINVSKTKRVSWGIKLKQKDIFHLSDLSIENKQNIDENKINSTDLIDDWILRSNSQELLLKAFELITI